MFFVLETLFAKKTVCVAELISTTVYFVGKLLPGQPPLSISPSPHTRSRRRSPSPQLKIYIYQHHLAAGFQINVSAPDGALAPGAPGTPHRTSLVVALLCLGPLTPAQRTRLPS